MLICTNFSFLSISVFFKNWCKNKKATHSFKKCVAHCDKISRSEIKTGANKRKTPEKSGAFLTPHCYQSDVIICVRTIKKIFSAVLRMTSNSHKIS